MIILNFFLSHLLDRNIYSKSMNPWILIIRAGKQLVFLPTDAGQNISRSGLVHFAFKGMLEKVYDPTHDVELAGVHCVACHDRLYASALASVSAAPGRLHSYHAFLGATHDLRSNFRKYKAFITNSLSLNWFGLLLNFILILLNIFSFDCNYLIIIKDTMMSLNFLFLKRFFSLL